MMDIRTHLQPRLLRDLDALSMAHSLEVRPAFLDDEVVKFMLNMPGPARRHPKELLLQAIHRFMPGGTSCRFEVPCQADLYFSLRQMADARFEAFARGDFFPRPLGGPGNPRSSTR